MGNVERRCEITSKGGTTKAIITRTDYGVIHVVMDDGSKEPKYGRYFNNEDIAGLLNHLVLFGCEPSNGQSYKYFIGDKEVSAYD